MTPKQRSYVANRAAGLGKQKAAREAGYAVKSAAVSASCLERDPKIKRAIEDARKSRHKGAGGAAKPATPEDYLLAVVRGTEPPDPVRVGAARALLPFLKAPERVPVKSETPREMQRTTERDAERRLLDEWAEKAAAIRSKMGRRWEREHRPAAAVGACVTCVAAAAASADFRGRRADRGRPPACGGADCGARSPVARLVWAGLMQCPSRARTRFFHTSVWGEPPPL